MERIIVVGGGGHAKVVISLLKKMNKFIIIGYTDKFNKGGLLGIEYLGNDEELARYFKEGVTNIAIGIGQIKSSVLRREIVNYAKKIGFNFPSIISTTAIINEDVEIGYGTVIMDGVIINSGTRLGDFSIINTNSSIDHDCILGNYVHIAPGVTLSGEVKIGDNVLIGTGANSIQSISINDDCIIAAGSSVQTNIERKGIYRGIPAKFVSEL